MTNAEAEKLVNETANRLSEHFGAVQILVSWMDGGHTKGYKFGAGDWYARQGLAHEFITEDIAMDTARKLASELNKPDEGDAWKVTT